MEFVTTTTRGARQLLKGHYIYSKTKTGNNGNTYWECVERRSGNGCKVKIVLDEGGNFLNQTGEHTHPPNPVHVFLFIRTSFIRTLRLGFCQN